MATKGKFIVFEGTDGSGKTTQLRLLETYLRSRGLKTYLTREPTDSAIGTLLRSCMNGGLETNEHTIAALFAADRLDHLHTAQDGILQKLDEGVTVLCDRFYFSSFAYNGGLVPLEWVVSLNTPAMETIRPDLTVFVDLSPEEAMKRVSHRGEAERYETLERQRAIRAKYFEIFDRFKDENHHIVKSEEDMELTQANIRKIVDEVLF